MNVGLKQVEAVRKGVLSLFWMRDQTSLNIRTNLTVVAVVSDDGSRIVTKINTTGAMAKFVMDFDEGRHPELVRQYGPSIS